MPTEGRTTDGRKPSTLVSASHQYLISSSTGRPNFLYVLRSFFCARQRNHLRSITYGDFLNLHNLYPLPQGTLSTILGLLYL